MSASTNQESNESARAGDVTFTTFIPTPCFPSYPSNHASGTNGGLEAMRRVFGAAGHDITIRPAATPWDAGLGVRS